MNAPAKTEDFAIKIPDGVYAETVLSVEHYTDHLFRFRMTRPAGFRFRSGEFAMIGLMVGEKPIYRAYSIASPARRGTRILLDQGSGWPVDLASSGDQAR